MSLAWKRLPLQDSPSHPPLFFSYKSSLSGYDISLTDLAHVWSECVNHKQIIQLASKHDSSIDPSEDEDQFSVLLGKISDALNGLEGTTIAVEGHKNEGDLRLCTTTPLPAPLEPLIWDFHLVRLPQSAVTRHILFPVIKGATDREARITSLMEHLREKDWALGKLFDKIETSGIDLSTVFPGLTGTRPSRKGSTFSQASKLIKGVAPFDEEAWNAEFLRHHPGHDESDGIINELSAADLPLNPETLELISHGWWSRIDSTGERNVPNSNALREEGSKRRTTEKDESEDEFETRETPPRLRESSRAKDTNDESIGKKTSKIEKGRNEPSGESAPGRQSPNPQLPQKKGESKARSHGTIEPKVTKRRPPSTQTEESTEPDVPLPAEKPKHKTKGLKTIGGKKPKKRTTTMSEESPETASDAGAAQRSSHPDNLEDSQEDGEDMAIRPSKRKPSDSEAKEEAPPSPEKKPPKARAGTALGQIGGKKKQKPATQEQTKQEASADSEDGGHMDTDGDDKPRPSATKPSKRPNKLGMIGGGKSQRKTPGQNKPAEPSTEDDSEPGKEKMQATMVSSGEKSPKRERSRSPTRNSAPTTTKAPSPQKEKSKQEEEETPEQKANRKREELKQQLASGASRGPAKKKRRF